MSNGLTGRVRPEFVGRKILSRDRAKEGLVTSESRRCQLEGCCGLRLGVRWADGRHTFPCTRGLETLPDGSLKIV